MAIASVSPLTGETLREFAPHTPAQVEQKVARAAKTFHEFRRIPMQQRAVWLHSAAKILDDESEKFGRIMTLEMGKTFKSAIAEARKCASGCRYYADNAAHHLADEVIVTDASRSFARYQPLGTVLAVMPWNFPFWQVFRFAAPALMAGNTGLLKHSSNVPQCALAIEDILHRAGFPEGAFQTLLIESDRVGTLLDDDRIAAATLTGSEPAGRAIAGRAGCQIKKTVLELGGSDPFIVMSSADFEAAVTTAVSARTINNGQSCIAAKRFFVAESIYEEFEARFIRGMNKLVSGDPMEAATELGPLATSRIRDDLHKQVEQALGAGAKAVTGGFIPQGPGNFYPPTVLTEVPRTSPVFHEEFFGPVAMLFRVRNAAEAIELANDSPFGLGSSVWTRDENEIALFSYEIEAGQVFINAPVASDPRLPFGGIKRSGYGRELSMHGIREFVNCKTVYIK